MVYVTNLDVFCDSNHRENLKKNQFLSSLNIMMTGIWFDTCLRLKKTLKLMFDIFGNRKISYEKYLKLKDLHIINSALLVFFFDLSQIFHYQVI